MTAKQPHLQIKKCANFHYTLKDQCPICSLTTNKARPPRFSTIDKHADKRRKELYTQE
ncbi:MAG: ribosome biogenesis protein [DPANN group archaeon]|nr:ribosome biogenesis protein [DPANN group archaeon]